MFVNLTLTVADNIAAAKVITVVEIDIVLIRDIFTGRATCATTASAATCAYGNNLTIAVDFIAEPVKSAIDTALFAFATGKRVFKAFFRFAGQVGSLAC